MGEYTTVLWSSHHQVLCDGLWNYLEKNFKTDFTLSTGRSQTEAQELKAHFLILSIFCPMLKPATEKNNIEFIFEKRLNIDETDVKNLLELLYKGQIQLSIPRLETLKTVAQFMNLEDVLKTIEQSSNVSETDKTLKIGKLKSIRKTNKSIKTLQKATTISKNKKNPCPTDDGENSNSAVQRIVRSPSKNRPAKFGAGNSSSCKSQNLDMYESPHFNSVSQTCLLCDKKFKSKQIFRQHVRCHRDPNIMRQCPHCPIKIYSKTNLSNHMAWKHQRDLEGNLLEKKYKCDECDFTCVAEFQLRSHKGYKHGIKRQKCDKCSYSCRTHADLVKHKDGVHGELRPFMCETCGFCTKTRSSFRLHLTIHQDKIPCNVCGVLYKYRALSRHKRNAHGETQNSFSCHMCSYATKCKSYLKVHLAKVHKLINTNAGKLIRASSSHCNDILQNTSSTSDSGEQNVLLGVNDSSFYHSHDVFCDL